MQSSRACSTYRSGPNTLAASNVFTRTGQNAVHDNRAPNLTEPEAGDARGDRELSARRTRDDETNVAIARA